MAVDPTSNWRADVDRLLDAPLDLVGQGACIWRSAAGSVRSTPHLALSARYRSELRKALGAADVWWEMMLAAQERRLRDRARAEALVRDMRPAGPCSDPRVIRVLRKYWLACCALNATMTAQHQVPPQELLLQWLVADGLVDEAKAIAMMPYWPIGLDAEGQWI